jgi:signal transduction histidine kinase
VSGGSLRTRITLAVLAAAVIPVAAFGALLLVNGDPAILTLVLTALVVAALVGLAVGGYLVGSVTSQLRALGIRLERITAGERPDPLPPAPDDELGRLAELQEDLAADLARRNRQVERAVAAITAWAPGDGTAALLLRAAADARDGLGLVDARIVLGDPASVEWEERVPGEPQPVRAELRSGGEVAGLLVGHAPATTRWEPADQDLLELFAASVAVSLRDADLLARVEAQNERLLALDAEKDDFLRGVSHNLQTPLTRIRAYADQLAAEQSGGGTSGGQSRGTDGGPGRGTDRGSGAPPGDAPRAPTDGAPGGPADGRQSASPDRRLAIIAEQSERLSRMVRQLLTVSRLDSGVLRPVAEVFALGPRVRRAWEALGAGDVPFELVDDAGGWLAVADPDHVDQVIWALLDNAVKYGGGAPVTARLGVDADRSLVRLTIADRGPGVSDADAERLFSRYTRGGESADRDGTGLGLYVGRALARANGGELVLETAKASGTGPGAGAGPAARAGPSAGDAPSVTNHSRATAPVSASSSTGAAFILSLPAEAPTEA